jgi:hypothetical protein
MYETARFRTVNGGFMSEAVIYSREPTDKYSIKEAISVNMIWMAANNQTATFLGESSELGAIKPSRCNKPPVLEKTKA